MSTILPASDGFTSAGYGSWETTYHSGLYLRARGASTDPAYGSGGTGYSLGSSAWRTVLSTITDRWWTQPQLFTDDASYPPSNPQPATLCDTNSSGNVNPAAFLFREFADDDVETELTWKLLANATTIVNAGSARSIFVGVCARVRAGSVISGGTSDPCLDQLTGYFAGSLYSAVGGHRYVVWRVDAGTITRLWTDYASDAASVASPVSWQILQPWYTHGLRLVVTGTGATVTLSLYATVRGGWSLVGTTTDTSGSRITTAGRCGFFSSHEYAGGGGLLSAPAINYWCAGPAGGATVVRDEWQRLNVAATSTVQATSTPLSALPTGRNLASAFYGDLHGSSSYVRRIGEDGSNSRLVFDASSSARTGYYTSQRVSTSPVAQDRKVDVIFPSGGGSTAIERWVGVCVRLVHATAGSNPTAGYRADLRYDDAAGAHLIYLSRIESTGLLTPLATATATLSLDTVYELRLVATNEGPDQFNSNPLLSVYLDGVQVALTATSAPGITVSGGGTVRDAASAHVVTGYGEGLYVRLTLGAVRKIIVDDWTQGAGGSGSATVEDDQPSISLASESAGASDTFDVPDDWPVEETVLHPFYDHPFDSGHRYTGAAGDVRSVWKIRAGALDNDEVATLRAFVDDHAGVPFYWLPPHRTAAIACRFRGPGLVRRLVAAGVTEYDILIAEALS